MPGSATYNRWRGAAARGDAIVTTAITARATTRLTTFHIFRLLGFKFPVRLIPDPWSPIPAPRLFRFDRFRLGVRLDVRELVQQARARIPPPHRIVVVRGPDRFGALVVRHRFAQPFDGRRGKRVRATVMQRRFRATLADDAAEVVALVF